MRKIIFYTSCFVVLLAFASSCQNESIHHIGASKLVIMHPINLVDSKFDDDFKAALDLLYPIRCHDTVFIQDRIFIERIDLKPQYKREFVIPPSLLRDFFGSNNPDKKLVMREELFYLGDTSFEVNPDSHFLSESQTRLADQPAIIGDYLSGNRKNSMVYFICNDTLCKNYNLGGTSWVVYSDFAKLNCRIVSELRKKSRDELSNLNVILVLIPFDTTGNQINDVASNHQEMDTTTTFPERSGLHPAKSTSRPKPENMHAGYSRCPPDSVVIKINKQRSAIITEFRNLLHYVATTTVDSQLRRKYRDDAYDEINKIPRARIEGIPGNDLRQFLNTGFSRELVLTPVMDRCNLIAGVRIW